MVYALRELGFDYVFDTDFAADLTIMEEGAEILNRLTRYLQGDKSVRLPILTSCCPAWVNFFEHHFPDMLDIPSHGTLAATDVRLHSQDILGKEDGHSP